MVACVAVGLRYGQDANWDLRNYHYYGAYAFLHGRLRVDVAPSQLQTWFNPLQSLPTYFLLSYVPPRIAASVLSALSAFPIVLVVLIAGYGLTPQQRVDTLLRRGVAGLAGIGAFVSPMFLSELGTTFSDTLGSALLLAAILAVLAGRFAARAHFIAGLFLGLALALKLTSVFFVVAWVAAVVVVERRRFFRPVVLAGLGAALTYVPLGGVWSAYMFHKFGNPLFPLYNNVFKSAFYEPIAMSDSRFRPNGIADALRYFWEWPAGLHPSAEVGFADMRFTLLLILMPLVAAVLIDRRMARGPAEEGIFDPRARAFLLTFCIVSFLIWLPLFGIQRYVVALEQLAPLVVIILLSCLLRRRAVLLGASGLAILWIALSTVPANWERVPFTADWFEVKVPDALRQENTMFIMLSVEATAYVIPFLPPSDVFVRIEGNMPITPETGLGRVIAGKLGAHGGEVRTLAPSGYEQTQSEARLAAYGLRLDPGDCVDITSKFGELVSCRLVRVGS
ncbi:hypothetical protein FHS55_000236 [Angulomicrobium tetraedrale]|uniref:Glycosyltransferase RgtA/B/C/D-like domain-containing protein n=1 Tax=Ancylobacter tetraedralis TaxID=217068 RepID=A0A839Z577_9HYPH|nr:hypothetical protein [Ancylobacter tetraedralis]MBB3769650.1 hypothetical protein [Ancylobacter tetraedralis]